MLIYSKTTGGFYPLAYMEAYVAAGSWPTDGVEVTQEQREALYGKQIVADQNGFPIEYIAPGLTIGELKVLKNAEINADRLRANSTSFPHAGKLFSSDLLSRSDIDSVANHIALFGTFPLGFPGGWKATDNSIISMPTVDAFKMFYQSMTAHGAANFNHSQQLKAALMQAETSEEIIDIVW